MCFVIQGTSVNWYHSLDDIERDGELRPAFECSEDCLKKLAERKRRGKILWAFKDNETYKKLEEALKTHSTIPVVGVSTKGKGDDRFPKRNIVLIGRVSRDDLVGRCECDYWPQGDKWDYKFFIEVDLWLDKNNYDKGIEYPVFQGSLAEIDCRLVNKIRELAVEESSYRAVPRAALSECPWKVNGDVLKRLEDELFAKTIDLEFLIRGAAYGNVLLAGPPGVGKSKAAVAVAKAFGGDYVLATAHALWFRRDVIGGESIGPNGVYWRSGLLIKAYNKAARHIQAGSPRLVFMIIDEVNRADADKAFADFFTVFPTPFCRDWNIPPALIDEIKSYREKDEEAGRFIENYGQLGDEPLRLIRVVATMNVKDWRNLFLTGEAFLRRFIIIKAECNKNYEEYIDKEKARDEVKKAVLEYLKERQDCVPPAAVLGALRLLDLKDDQPTKDDVAKAINAVIGSRDYLLGRGGRNKA